jgi:AbrB family looped-hinge helix DNA binding protein
MPLEWKPATSTHIDKHGRIVIPVEYRRELGVECGDKVLMRIKDGRLEVYTLANAITRTQEMMKQYTGGRTGLVDEFIADRRREWGEEE